MATDGLVKMEKTEGPLRGKRERKRKTGKRVERKIILPLAAWPQS
jgi:hypothetical protein